MIVLGADTHKRSHTIAAVAVRGSSVGDSVETGEPGVVWLWEAPALHMPLNRAEVAVTLRRSTGRVGEAGARPQTMRLRLDERVVVLPVHVHEFVEAGEAFSRFTRKEAGATFDPPGLLTAAQTTRDPVMGNLKTSILAEDVAVGNVQPDQVWDDANVQFRLVGYEQIPQREGLEDELITPEEAAAGFGGACSGNARVFDYHRARSTEAGLHIYIGGEIASTRLLEDLPGASCGPAATCGLRIEPDDLILLDAALLRRVRHTIAHELGHVLGLDHITNDRPCGRRLVGSSDEAARNLMNPSPSGGDLTAAQVARARTTSCDAARRWGVPAPACARR